MYKLIHSASKWDYSKTEVKNRYLKFYGKNKFGEFYEYDSLKIEVFDPKRSRFGLYRFDGEKLILKKHFSHPQGNRILRLEYHITKNNDTLVLEGDSYIKTFIPLHIPEEALKYQPDW